MMKKPFVILLGAMTALSMSTFAPASADDSSWKKEVPAVDAYGTTRTLAQQVLQTRPTINELSSGSYNPVFPNAPVQESLTSDGEKDVVTVYYSDKLKDSKGSIPLHLDASMQIPKELAKYTYYPINGGFLTDAPNSTVLTFKIDNRVKYLNTTLQFMSDIWAPQAIYQSEDGTKLPTQSSKNLGVDELKTSKDSPKGGVASFENFMYQEPIVNSIQEDSPKSDPFKTGIDTLNNESNKDFSVLCALRKGLNNKNSETDEPPQYFIKRVLKDTNTTLKVNNNDPFVSITPAQAVQIADSLSKDNSVNKTNYLEFSGSITVRPSVSTFMGPQNINVDKAAAIPETGSMYNILNVIDENNPPTGKTLESRPLYVGFKLPTVTFDHNGGNGANEVVKVAGKIAENPQFPGITDQVFPKNPVFPGHTFMGWFTADGKRFDATTPVEKPITVYAVWDHAQAPGTVENVNRVGGSDRIATSLNLWRRTANRHVMVLAGTTGVPDAFTGGPFAALEGTTVVFTDKNHLSDSVVKAIKQNNVNKVFVLGGTGVVSDNVKNELKALGLEVVRIDGANRYATASAIADYIATLRGRTSGDLPVVLATGENFADSLVASPLAHKVKGAVLLTEGNNLGQVTEDYLKKSGNQIITVGNPATVAANNSVFKTRVIKSWVGKDRYSTAATVLKQEFPKAWHVAIVNGQSPADGAIAGGYISYLNGAVLFTRTDSLPAATRSVLRAGMRLEVVGGTARISPRVFQQLQIAVD